MPNGMQILTSFIFSSRNFITFNISWIFCCLYYKFSKKMEEFFLYSAPTLAGNFLYSREFEFLQSSSGFPLPSFSASFRLASLCLNNWALNATNCVFGITEMHHIELGNWFFSLEKAPLGVSILPHPISQVFPLIPHSYVPRSESVIQYQLTFMKHFFSSEFLAWKRDCNNDIIWGVGVAWSFMSGIQIKMLVDSVFSLPLDIKQRRTLRK